MNNSYLIWFLDGKYTIGFGSSAEDAKEKYLARWAKSIREVVSTDGFRNPPPQHLFLSCPVSQIDAEPTIHAPLDQTAPAPTLHGDISELKEQVAALSKALTDSIAKKDVPNEG